MTDRTPQDVIVEALEGASRVCITSSFQAECVVLTHMLREVRPDVPVLFLDTFHHFAQTLAYRDEMTTKWGLRLINLRAETPQVGLWQVESTEAWVVVNAPNWLAVRLETTELTWVVVSELTCAPDKAVTCIEANWVVDSDEMSLVEIAATCAVTRPAN